MPIRVYISNRGLDFIKKLEKFIPKAYPDEAGIWTIGFGTTRYTDNSPVNEGDELSLDEALGYLLHECDGIARKIKPWIKDELLQNEIDALISFCYNIGTPGFKTSTLLRKLNEGRPILRDYFTRWSKIHKDGKLVVSRGLVTRRVKEFRLFRSGIYF